MRTAIGATAALVRAILFLGQMGLGFFALVCFSGVILQIVDDRGGASGALARETVTVGTRIRFGMFCGLLGSLCIACAILLGRLRRHFRTSKNRVNGDMDEL